MAIDFVCMCVGVCGWLYIYICVFSCICAFVGVCVCVVSIAQATTFVLSLGRTLVSTQCGKTFYCSTRYPTLIVTHTYYYVCACCFYMYVLGVLSSSFECE